MLKFNNDNIDQEIDKVKNDLKIDRLISEFIYNSNIEFLEFLINELCSYYRSIHKEALYSISIKNLYIAWAVNYKDGLVLYIIEEKRKQVKFCFKVPTPTEILANRDKLIQISSQLVKLKDSTVSFSNNITDKKDFLKKIIKTISNI